MGVDGLGINILMPLGEIVIVMQPGEEAPRSPGMVRHQRETEFRLKLF